MKRTNKKFIQQEKRAARLVQEKRAAVLKAAIIDAKLVGRVRAQYDGSQGNAPEYDELIAAGKQEEAEWHAHDYAIEQVFNMLAEKGVDMEGVDELMLGNVYAAIS